MRDPVTGKGKIVSASALGKGNVMSLPEFKKANSIQALDIRKFNNFYPTLPSGGKYYKPNNEYEKTLTQAEIRQVRFAEKYYNQLRNTNRDLQVKKIVKASALSTILVQTALSHILDSKYDLYNQQTGKLSYQHFVPDYDMAHSLQRLLDNKPMEHDILLLKHEALEAELMDDPNSECYQKYHAAHIEANKTYNYQEECDRLRSLGILPTYSKKGDD